MAFRINFFKNDFSVHYLCLFIHNSRSKHSKKSTASNWRKHHFSEMSANNCVQF